MLKSLLFWSVITAVSALVIWWGTSLLDESSERLSVYYGIPDIVQGAVIVAVGSSFPELSAATLSTIIHGDFELGVSAIVGSAIFNIMVIPALSSLIKKQKMNVSKDLVYKEAQFYIISIATLLLVFSLSVIYFPVRLSPDLTQGEVNRWLALIPLVLYCLYVFIQYQDTVEFDHPHDAGKVSPLKNWGKLAASLLIILVGVEMLLRAAISFGEIFDTPSFLWGMTIVAAGTSLPDALMSIRKAMRQESVTSISNVLGSNIFDLCVCIPAGVLIAGASTINFTVAAPMMGVLIIATIILFTFMRTNFVLSEGESWILLGLYCLFIIWLILEYFEYLNGLPGVPH